MRPEGWRTLETRGYVAAPQVFKTLYPCSCILTCCSGPQQLLECESTVTYRLGSLVVKRPASHGVNPGSNPGPVILCTSTTTTIIVSYYRLRGKSDTHYVLLMANRQDRVQTLSKCSCRESLYLFCHVGPINRCGPPRSSQSFTTCPRWRGSTRN